MRHSQLCLWVFFFFCIYFFLFNLKVLQKLKIPAWNCQCGGQLWIRQIQHLRTSSLNSNTHIHLPPHHTHTHKRAHMHKHSPHILVFKTKSEPLKHDFEVVRTRKNVLNFPKCPHVGRRVCCHYVCSKYRNAHMQTNTQTHPQNQHNPKKIHKCSCSVEQNQSDKSLLAHTHTHPCMHTCSGEISAEAVNRARVF